MSGTAHIEPLDIAKVFGLDGLPDEDGNTRACPEGSFPRLMPKLENLYRFRKLENIYQKYPNPPNKSTGNTGTFDTRLTGIELSAVRIHNWAMAGRRVDNTGSEAYFNIWAPFAQQPVEFSLVELSAMNGDGDNLQTLETGWIVEPNIYGDNNPHLFIYFTTHNYKPGYAGCRDLTCPGFVQTNSNVVIRGALSTISTIGGDQYDLKLGFYRDPGGDHKWWLKVGDNYAGYYPNSLFNSQGIANHCHGMAYYGEIVDCGAGGLHTTTDMGSGRFPFEGWQKAAYIRNMRYVDMNNVLQDSTGLSKTVTNPDYYDLILYSSTDPNWREYLYFGGPGRVPGTGTISDFSVAPLSLPLGNPFTISYTAVSDTGGSGLKRVELWRAHDNDGPWAEIKQTSLSGKGPISGSFSDAPRSVGTYWYGLHLQDSAGNVSLEPRPPGPIEVTVTAPVQQPNVTPYQPTGWSDKIVVSNVMRTNIDSVPLYNTDPLYVDWAVINNGTSSASGYSIQLYVDGALLNTWSSCPLLKANASWSIKDYSIGSLSIGTHTIKVAVANNEYTKTINILNISTAIDLTTPSDNTSFGACSLYSPPTFSWAIGDTFKSYKIQFSPIQDFSVTSVTVGTSSNSTAMNSNTWKRVLSIPGGTVYWRVVGTRMNRAIATSKFHSLTVESPQTVGNPTISPTSKASLPELSWQNNCNPKFKTWFGSDNDFTKKTAFAFNISNPTDNGGVFTKILTSGQWMAIRKLVEDVSGSTIHWYVESWDGLGRYSKTSVMNFVLTD